MMRVLVTGAGGFIGSHMVDACVRRGWDVIGLDQKWLKDWTPSEEEPGSVYCNDVSLMIQPDFDLCFHLAAEARIQPSFDSPMLCVLSNIVGTARVLEKARQCGGRVIYAGSSTADSDPRINVYAMSKLTGEELCRTWSMTFGVKTAVARFYNVYGPRQIEDGMYATVVGIFEKQKREGRPLTITGDGRQRRDFTHVADIVSGLLAIAEHGGDDGQVYSLGSGTNYSILEVAEMFGVPVEFLPKRPGEVETTLVDTTDAMMLGWRPTKRLEDYVREVIF
jgi:UDP-glucose 4-epimerase